MRKRFYHTVKQWRPYREPIYLTENDLVKGSRYKHINDINLYDFNFHRSTGMSFFTSGVAVDSRNRMNRADLIVFTDRYGEKKVLKDRFGDYGQ